MYAEVRNLHKAFKVSNAHVKRELVKGRSLDGVDGEGAVGMNSREPAAHWAK